MESGRPVRGSRLSVEGGTDAGTGWQVEQWARMLVATAIAVAALGGLDGVLQIGAFALATLLAGLTGTGVRFFAKREPLGAEPDRLVAGVADPARWKVPGGVYTLHQGEEVDRPVSNTLSASDSDSA